MLLLVLACQLGISAAAHAQQAQGAEHTLDTHTYDVRDLLEPWQEQQDQQPTEAQLQAYRNESLASVIRAIKDGAPSRAMSDDPNDGGTAGGVGEEGGRLTVRTTAEHHAAIRQMLEERRQPRGAGLRYTYQLLIVEPATFRQLFAEQAEGVAWRVQGPDQFPTRLGERESGITGLALLNDEQADQLLASIRQAVGSNFASQRITHTDYNGRQTEWPMYGDLFLAHGDQVTPIAEAGPIAVGSVAAMAAQINSHGVINANPASAHLDFRTHVATATGELLEVPDPQAGEGAVSLVPQMNRADSHLDLDVPSGQWMLVIGPTVQGRLPSPIRGNFHAMPGQPDTAGFDDTRHVVWLVRVLVVELIEPGEN